MININAQFHFLQLYSLEAQRQEDFKSSSSFYKQQFTSLDNFNFETWLCHCLLKSIFKPHPLAPKGHLGADFSCVYGAIYQNLPSLKLPKGLPLYH